MHLFSAPCGDMTARYEQDDRTGAVGLLLHPAGRPPQRGGGPVEPLVQVSLVGDRSIDLWSQGATLRNRSTVRDLALDTHRVEESAAGTTVTVELAARSGLRALHHLGWQRGRTCVEVTTTVVNGTGERVSLQLLSSFCTLGRTAGTAQDPAADGPGGPDGPDDPADTVVHRLRSGWSSEGRLVSHDLRDLHLEGWPAEALGVERYGQLGTMPVRGYAPGVVVEDRAAHAWFGAQLCWPGSWQIELYRRGGGLSVAGGLGDADFGHWRRDLAPGERFRTPAAWLTACVTDTDDCFRRLVAMQDAGGPHDRPAERHLPAVVNEFATTWGRPTHDGLVAMADRLAGTPVGYLVADAGWYQGGHGDWTQVKAAAFPGGLAATAKAVRERGLALGLWVEAETCDEKSTAFSLTGDLLHRDGAPVTAGQRRFFDLRKTRVADLLLDRIGSVVTDNGIGYLKIDYNEPLGAGVDGAESPGEGLRQQVAAALDFTRRLRLRLPGVVIENCASGGFRHEPASMASADVASYSDAMEGLHLPVTAADTNRLLPGSRALVWAVPRAADTPRELVYKLATGLLGRLCLSGDLLDLDPARWALTRRALDLYGIARPALAGGDWRRYGPRTRSYRRPQGWQALVRTAADGRGALAVLHAFDAFADASAGPIRVPLAAGPDFTVAGTLTAGPEDLHVEDGALHWRPREPFSAVALWLIRP